MVLTILLPDDVRLGPKWLLPLIEGVLLVVVIAGDPGKINRSSRWLRALSIVLVSVLVIGAMWATGLATKTERADSHLVQDAHVLDSGDRPRLCV
jgi:hypothetical protein